MATDAFSAQIVELVRRMPDEAILELVKNRLGMAPFSAFVPVSSRARPTRAAEVEPAEPKTKRTGAQNKVKPSKRRAATASADRKTTLESVERIVKASTGVSASEVARTAGIPQPRAAAALKELKLGKRIFQGGDRRFARYAGDPKVAEGASLAARTSAAGPNVVKKPTRAKPVKATK